MTISNRRHMWNGGHSVRQVFEEMIRGFLKLKAIINDSLFPCSIVLQKHLISMKNILKKYC